MKSNWMWVALSVALFSVLVLAMFMGENPTTTPTLPSSVPVEQKPTPKPIDEWEEKRKELEENLEKIEKKIKEKESAVSDADYIIETYGKMIKDTEDRTKAEQYYEEIVRVQANRQKYLKEWEGYLKLREEWQSLKKKFQIAARIKGK